MHRMALLRIAEEQFDSAVWLVICVFSEEDSEFVFIYINIIYLLFHLLSVSLLFATISKLSLHLYFHPYTCII